MSAQADRQRAALNRIAKDDPELAARLVLMTLPGAASRIGGTLSYVLDLDGLGAHRPPYVTDPSDYVSYGYTSRQIYGFAYRTLRRPMKVLGIEIPSPEELMPGPIDGTTEFAVAPAAAAKTSSNGAASNGSGDLEAAATT